MLSNPRGMPKDTARIVVVRRSVAVAKPGEFEFTEDVEVAELTDELTVAGLREFVADVDVAATAGEPTVVEFWVEDNVPV